MAEIEITLPTVQYGNVKVRATPEELGLESAGDAAALGAAAAIYLNLFQQGFKHGAAMDVDANLGDVQAVSVSRAHHLLDEGLGGVTELSEGTSEKAEADAADMRARHQAEAEAAGKAPWAEKVDTKRKPWETGEQAPKAPVVTADW
jgi:hypothetical protein